MHIECILVPLMTGIRLFFVRQDLPEVLDQPIHHVKAHSTYADEAFQCCV